MKSEINALNEFIESTNVFTRWGNFCVNRTDKGMPYGIGTISDCAGNIYGYDENETCAGYMYVNNITSKQPNVKVIELDVEIHINIFTPSKKIGETNNYFIKPLELLGKLVRQKYTCKFINQTSNKYSFQEMATIAVNLRVFVPCDSVIYNDPIC